MTKLRRRASDYLLVDVSNSFTKLAFSSQEKLGKATRIATRNVTAAELQRVLKRHDAKVVIVSSVVPKKNSALRKAAGKRPTLFIDHTTDLGVGIDYPNARSIGADRLANAAAVAALYGYPAIVVDFGTAVTFDVVSAQREYIGGVIAPGLESMTTFLYQRTALLPKLTLREPASAIGKTTRAAMMSGAVHGYRGLVAEILRRIRAERFAKKKVKIVATGGYAGLIAQQLPEIEAVHPNLTLEGLRIVANRTFA